mmetsp:Transcript_122432/g.391756  ORF Transcript_122432/g.391756 Transcript_122432/m.391756 type:complete len:85 (-) Transcript_122432:87-341(-)
MASTWLATSRSVPSLLRSQSASYADGWHVPVLPRRPRLKHAEMYPSIHSRIRLAEEHLSSNASTMKVHREHTDELHVLAKTPQA